MAEVKGFQGIRYRLDQPEAASEVIAPPYDVISPEGQAALEARNPHNVIRLELPRGSEEISDPDNRYARAAQTFQAWRESGVLIQDAQPTLYVYGQRYDAGDGRQERLGLMAALKVEPYEAGVVLPHEQTFPKHKEDRFQLLSTARAQFSPIFGLYAAPESEVRARLEAAARQEPVAVAQDHEGVEHRLWAVSDPDFLAWASGVFTGKQVLIADGHHRYETSLRYRNFRREQDPQAGELPSDYVMIFLVEMDDPGLVLLPTHRMIREGLPAPEVVREKLAPYFRIEPSTLADADALEHHQLGIVFSDGTAWKLTLTDPSVLQQIEGDYSDAWRDLDVVLLHRVVLERALGLDPDHEIVYTRDAAEARDQVTSGEFQASFLQPYPRVEELKLVAGAGDKMPHKSTYFWPKAISGLVIYPED